MDDLSRLCIDKLRGMARKVSDTRPIMDWGWRMESAVDSLEKHAESGEVNGESLMNFFAFAFHLADALDPAKISAEKAGKAARARHFGHDILRTKAIGIYRSKDKWKSRRQAAKHIASELRTYAKENGIPPLSEDSGADTVYRWLTRLLADG